MSSSVEHVGLPLKGLVIDSRQIQPAPKAMDQWGALDLSGLRIKDGRSLRPWPSVVSFLNTANAERVTLLRNIQWGDDTYSTVRHSATNFFESAGGSATWTTRAIAALTAGTGTNNDYWGAALCPGNTGKGYYIFGARVLAMMFFWAASGGNISQVWSAGTPNPSRHVISFADRAVLFNQLVGGVIRGRLSQWSIRGDSLTWTGTGSGTREFGEFGGEIRGAFKQRGSLFVASEEAIVEGVESFDVDSPVYYRPLVSGGIGIWAPNSLVTYGDFAAWLSLEGFKAFDGQFHSIGAPIDKYIRSRLNPDAINTVCSTYWPEPYDLAIWALPMDGNTTPSELWAFHTASGTWHRIPIGYFASNPTALTYEHRAAGLLWNNAIFAVPWNDASMAGKRWSDFGGGVTDRLITGHSNGVTRTLDDSAPSSSVRVRFRTPAWTFEDSILFASREGGFRGASRIMPDDSPTLDGLTIKYRPLSASINSTVYVRISFDGGETFELLGSLSILAGSSSKLKSADLGCRVTGPNILLDISNEDSMGGTSAPYYEIEDFILRVKRSGATRIVA